MKKGLKLSGIMLLSVIVFSVLSCSPKKSDAEKALEAQVAELQKQMAALSQSNPEEAAELQTALETAQAGLETARGSRGQQGNQRGNQQQTAAPSQPVAAPATPAPAASAPPAAASAPVTATQTQAATTQTRAENIRQAVLNDRTGNAAQAAYNARIAEGGFNTSSPNNPADTIYQAVQNDRTGNPGQAAYNARLAEDGIAGVQPPAASTPAAAPPVTPAPAAVSSAPPLPTVQNRVPPPTEWKRGQGLSEREGVFDNGDRYLERIYDVVIQGIAYGGGSFVAAGNAYHAISFTVTGSNQGIASGYTSRYAASSSGGTIWTWDAIPGFTDVERLNPVCDIAYGNGTFVIIDCVSDGATIYLNATRSTDGGKTWTASRSVVRGYPSFLTYTGNRFLAVMRSPNSDLSTIITSVDGVNWVESAALNHPYGMRAFAYGGGKLVYARPMGTGYQFGYLQAESAASNARWTDTITDSSVFAQGVTINPGAIAYGNGRFLAAARRNFGADYTMAYSDDGITWTPLTAKILGDTEISVLSYGGGWFVAGGQNGKMAYSADGVQWTAITPAPFGTDVVVNHIVFGESDRADFIAAAWDAKASQTAHSIVRLPNMPAAPARGTR